MTNEQHNKYLGLSFLAYAGFQLFITLLMLAWVYLLVMIPSRPGDPGPPMQFFGFIFGFLFVWQMIFTIPAIVASYALLFKKKWARMASIVGAVMSAMSVPIGTAVCVYAFWFFMGDKWKEVYETQYDTSYARGLGSNDAEAWQPVDAENFREHEHEPKPGDWR